MKPFSEIGFFDAHAHYDDSRFAESFPGGGAAVLRDLFSRGVVCGVCNSASDLASARAARALANALDGVVFTAGIHPHEAAQALRSGIDSVMTQLEALLAEEKCVALGEIGLDFHYDFSPREEQQRLFALQMELAKQKNIPVVIHSREAAEPTLAVLRAFSGVRGVIHSCAFSAESVKELLHLGYYISFSSPVTFKNARGILDAVRAVPDDRLLIETDCPYLTPVPMRGKCNHSGYLGYTAAAVAAARNADPEQIRRLARENALRVFSLL